jgi:hypothetical protein
VGVDGLESSSRIVSGLPIELEPGESPEKGGERDREWEEESDEVDRWGWRWWWWWWWIEGSLRTSSPPDRRARWRVEGRPGETESSSSSSVFFSSSEATRALPSEPFMAIRDGLIFSSSDDELSSSFSAPRRFDSDLSLETGALPRGSIILYVLPPP